MTKEERVEAFKGLMDRVNDRDTDKLVKWLIINSDYFTAPASTIFHSNYEGGLFDHSRNVMTFALGLNKFMVEVMNMPPIPKQSIILIALIHDLCKTNVYRQEERFTKINNNRTWATYMGYVYEENLPFGHGMKSLYIVLKNQLVELSDEEAAAIQFHMGFYIEQAHIPYPYGLAMNDAMSRYPLVRLIQNADSCTGMIEKKIDYKAQAKPKR